MRHLLLTLLLALFASTVMAQAPAPEPPPLWDVQLGASFVGTNGNSDTAALGADFAAHRRGLIWQIESTATAVRTDSNDVTTAERYLGMVRVHRKLTGIIGMTAGEQLERDRFAGISARSILDGGLSWALVRVPEWTLDGVTSVAWKHESPIAGDATDHAVGVLQLLSRLPFGGGGDTTQRFAFFPDFTESSDYRSEAEITAQASLNTRLALKLGYLWRYSHTPIPGFKTTDQTMTASVVLRWKADTPAPQ